MAVHNPNGRAVIDGNGHDAYYNGRGKALYLTGELVVEEGHPRTVLLKDDVLVIARTKYYPKYDVTEAFLEDE